MIYKYRIFKVLIISTIIFYVDYDDDECEYLAISF